VGTVAGLQKKLVVAAVQSWQHNGMYGCDTMQTLSFSLEQYTNILQAEK
jgi:hypothetical protein